MSDPSATPISRFCASCGTALAVGARFCVKCGAQQSAPPPAPPAASPEAAPSAPANHSAPPPPPDAAPSAPANHICAGCGSPSPAGSRFCLNCGTPQSVSPAPPAAISDAAPSSPASHICASCGNPSPAGSRFCLSCGTPQSASQAPPAASPDAAPSAPASHICASCGSPSPAGSRFCLNCGTPQSVSPVPPAASPDAAPSAPASHICASCGSPSPAGSRFCLNCGAQQSAPPAASPVEPTPQTPPAGSGGFKVTLVDPGPYRGRVVLALRQLLQLDGPSAGRFVAAAPVVLAVGLTAEMAERLRTTLAGTGATIQVQGPPPPPQVAAPKVPRPEPRRSIDVAPRIVRERPPRRGPCTLTGLVLGRGCSYLAFARAQGKKLLAPPDLVRIDGRTGIPTAVRLAESGTTELLGNRALASWVQDPGEVSLGFTEELGPQADAPLAATRAFLKFLNYRLVEVLGPDAASPREGAVTSLAVGAAWSAEQSSLLAETVEQAGFPLVHIVPEPLAAAVHYLSPDAREPQYFLVVDWGSQGLDLATVENLPGAEPTVIDTIELPLGGVWFDTIIDGWLAERLQAELSDEDSRALALFARQFKEDASAAFAEGRAEHVQYCVIPAGMPPTRISVSKPEFDKLFADSRAQFEQAVAEAPGRVGFRPDHYDQVVLVGGAASMYFAREAAQAALGRSPMVPRNPEETIARGLVFWGARQSSTGA